MLLGLDLGTTNVKALLADSDGRTVAVSSAPVNINYLSDGGVEQSIEDIWSATLSVISEAAAACASDIQAIGVASQGGAMQIQDADGKYVGPVIGWQDSRGRDHNQRIAAELGRNWFRQHVGHGRSGLTIGQLLRLRATDALPESFRVGFVGDVIVARLCGRAAHDATSLSLALLYNPSLNSADPELLGRLGLTPERLPELLPASTPAGRLLDEVAARTSLPAGIPVSPAVHDQYAAALGCGAVKAGDVMFGAGTAWVLLAVMDKLVHPVIDSAFVCRHPAAGLFGQIVSLGNGGASLSWVTRTLGLNDSDPAKIDEMILSVPPGSEGLRFRPLLASGGAGLAPQTAGRLDGIGLRHTPAHIVRSVVEGLACELARYLGFLTTAGIKVERLLMCGAAAASSATPQIITNTTGLPVACMAESETSAMGAAMIGRGLCHPASSLAEISSAMKPASRAIEPDSRRPLYAKLFEHYLACLPTR